LAGATLKKTLPGTPHFFASDYTRAAPVSRLEICIRQIHFSDCTSYGEAETAIVSLDSRQPPSAKCWGYPCLRALPSYNASPGQTAPPVVLNCTAMTQWHT